MSNIRPGWFGVWVKKDSTNYNQYQFWCCANIDKGGNDWYEHYWGDNVTYRLYEFKRKNDAMFFKLSFADFVGSMVDGHGRPFSDI